MSKAQIFAKLRAEDPNTFLYVSRTCDLRVVKYRTTTKFGRLPSNVCEHTYVDLDKPAAEELPVGNVLVENFYGFQPPSMLQDRVFLTAIKAMPERLVRLKVSESGTVKMYGKVGSCINAVIVCVHMHVTFSHGVVPSLDKIEIHGLDPKTRSPVQEDIEVTSEMRSKFNVTKILSEYMKSPV